MPTLIRRISQVTALLATFWLVAGCQGTGDRLEVPTPSADRFAGMTLSCLYATSINHIVAGGWLDGKDGSVEAIIVRSWNGGKTWKRIGSETWDQRDFIVQNLHFNDRIRGWASGLRILETGPVATVARTEDGGGHWRESVIPESRASFVSNTRELVFVTDSVGAVEIVFEDHDTGEFLANVYTTSDGGRNWIIDSFKEQAEDDITDPAISFFSESQGYRLSSPNEDGVQTVEYTVTKGETWVVVASLHLQRFSEFY
ncbi:MAG: hypothetical protein V3W41_08550 [Planctomycetota bacterium]